MKSHAKTGEGSAAGLQLRVRFVPAALLAVLWTALPLRCVSKARDWTRGGAASHPREQIALFPPAVAHPLNESIQEKTSHLFYFWIAVDAARAASACTAHFPSGRIHP
jgi:hypothetical protein